MRSDIVRATKCREHAAVERSVVHFQGWEGKVTADLTGSMPEGSLTSAYGVPVEQK